MTPLAKRTVSTIDVLGRPVEIDMDNLATLRLFGYGVDEFQKLCLLYETLGGELPPTRQSIEKLMKQLGEGARPQNIKAAVNYLWSEGFDVTIKRRDV